MTASLVSAALLYLALLAILFVLQSRIVYPGWWRGVQAGAGDRRLHPIALTTEDGLAGRLLFAAPERDRPVILFFHGNGDSAASGAVAIAPYLDAGYGAVVPEYRGYDGLPGAPSEQGLYRDARAARRWMAAHGMGRPRRS